MSVNESVSAVAIRGLTKCFGTTAAVDGVDLDIEPGSFVALLGPSGCGKTTTLRMLVGLEEPTSGAILIGGKDVAALPAGERGVGLVFQDFAIFPHMTVRANLSFAPRMAGEAPGEVDRRVEEIAGILELSALLDRRPRQLNASELQRVSIGRTLVSQPEIILFDEPLSNVEAGLRARMRGELKALHRRFKQTAVYVTHDQVEAMALADRVAVMDKGRIVQVGTPEEIYSEPANAFVAGFIGAPPMNLLQADVPAPGDHAVIGSLRVALDAAVGAGDRRSVVFGVRPEDVQIEAGRNEAPVVAQGRVAAIEPVGAETITLVDGDGWTLTSLSDGAAPAEIDEVVNVRVLPGAVKWFAADGGQRLGSPRVADLAGRP